VDAAGGGSHVHIVEAGSFRNKGPSSSFWGQSGVGVISYELHQEWCNSAEEKKDDADLSLRRP
jgi:hypothetical protein